MAIMDRVRVVTATAATPDHDGASVAVCCSDCGQRAGAATPPVSWGYARERGCVQRTCPECVRASLDEIETFVRF